MGQLKGFYEELPRGRFSSKARRNTPTYEKNQRGTSEDLFSSAISDSNLFFLSNTSRGGAPKYYNASKTRSRGPFQREISRICPSW